jgi:hypothetical protein
LEIPSAAKIANSVGSFNTLKGSSNSLLAKPNKKWLPDAAQPRVENLPFAAPKLSL